MDKARYPAVFVVAVLAAISTVYLNFLVVVPRSRPAAELVSDISASRYQDNVTYLASDELKGRGDGTPELDRASEYIASRFHLGGLRPMGDNGTFFQSFEITTGADLGGHNDLQLNGDHLKLNDDFSPMLFSDSADVDAPLIFVGYGITAPELNYDDY